MKNVRQCFLWQLVLITVGVVLWLSPLLAYAGTNPKITISGAEAGKAVDIVGTVAAELEDAGVTVGNGRTQIAFEFLLPDVEYDSKSDTYTIEVNMQTYNNLPAKTQQKVMQITLSAIQNSPLSSPLKNKLYNDICALDETTTSLVRQLNDDVRADFWSAYMWFKPFTGPIGTALGLFCLFLFTVLGLSIVFDLAYINVPIVQAMINGHTKQGGAGKPPLISLEAWNAVKTAESQIGGGRYVNANWEFFKHKTSQYVVISICILYLASGDLFGAIAGFIDYFRGFLQ